MSSDRFLIDLALILLSTKAFGMLTRKVRMPQVVGALLAGLLLGPACLGLIHGSEFLSQLSGLGVIVIMFSAGLETDLKQLGKNGAAGFWVALIGVLVPLAGGALFAAAFHTNVPGSGVAPFYQHLFVGVILTATSVSITVETLKEIGRLNTRVGNCILAAALIDDVLGLVCLTIISSLAGSGDDSITWVLLKIVLFFVLALGLGLAGQKLLTWYSHKLRDEHFRRFPILAFVLCLFLAFVAEHFFGVADIIGAFAAGLVVGATPQAPYIESRFRPLSYLLLTPIFFANIGITIHVGAMTSTVLLATVVLLGVSVVTKLVGCGLGARLCGMNARQSVQVGLGMVCRGEVALIVADKGASMGLMPPDLVIPIVIMVVGTAILTPVLLKLAFHGEESAGQPHKSPLLERIHLAEHMDAMGQWLLALEAGRKRPDAGGTGDEGKTSPRPSSKRGPWE